MIGGGVAMPNLVANMYGESSTVVAPPIQGGYTSFSLVSIKMFQLLGN
jgi:hypothetical protein